VGNPLPRPRTRSDHLEEAEEGVEQGGELLDEELLEDEVVLEVDSELVEVDDMTGRWVDFLVKQAS
jgi:hypothetical protein